MRMHVPRTVFLLAALSEAPLLGRYSVQHTRQQDILTRFPADLDALRAVTILPPARTTEMRTLLDLIPEQRMRDWARHCEASHRSLGSKVDTLWASSSLC